MKLFRSYLIKNKRKKLLNRTKKSKTKVSGKFSGNRNSRMLNFIRSTLFLKISSGIFLLVLIIIIILLVIIYKKFDLGNQTTWDFDESINIAILGIDEKPDGYRFVDAANILSIDPQKNKVGIISIEADTLSSIKDTKTTIRKSYNSQIEGQDGYVNTTEALENFLSIEIDKYVAITKDEYLDIQSIFGDLSVVIENEVFDKDYEVNGQFLNIGSGTKVLGNVELLGIISADAQGEDQKLKYQNQVISENISKLYSPKTILKLLNNIDKFVDLDTNLSKREVFELLLVLRKSKTNLSTGYTKSASYLEMENGDLKPIYERIDNDIQKTFLDPEIIKEQARVEVLNATDKSGFANNYARRLNTIGFRVVRSGNAINNQEDTIIYMPEQIKYENTKKELLRQFPNAIVIQEKYKYRHIGEVVIVIGKDSL